ncbi:MAG: response regulator [Proteobacteria bacterium]|nr:response regulator [Pseudomonadota bacterium]
MNIMIVDDNLMNRTSMEKIMKEMGKTHTFSDGLKAIKFFGLRIQTMKPIDLILLDIVMPAIDGLRMLNRIRQIEKASNVAIEKQVKIVMVTSHANKELVVNCLMAGCDSYIVKPFTKEVMLKKLKELELDPALR